jgi:hypothetical protein
MTADEKAALISVEREEITHKHGLLQLMAIEDLAQRVEIHPSRLAAILGLRYEEQPAHITQH